MRSRSCCGRAGIVGGRVSGDGEISAALAELGVSGVCAGAGHDEAGDPGKLILRNSWNVTSPVKVSLARSGGVGPFFWLPGPGLPRWAWGLAAAVVVAMTCIVGSQGGGGRRLVLWLMACRVGMRWSWATVV